VADDPTYYDVAVTFAGDETKTINTLVVPSRDVVIALERDEVGDPHQSDRVILHSIGGAVRIGPLEIGGPGVRVDPDTRRVLCTFRDVPYGAYRVAVDVGDGEKDLILDLVVRQKGVFLGSKKLGSKEPDAPLPAEIPVHEEPPSPADAEGPRDQVEPFQGRK
jgi:hypothetical protein